MTPEQVYSALLRLYPKSFRQEYGATIVETFREMRRDTQLRPFRLWLFVIGDLCRSIWREYISHWKSGPRGFALQWVLACALGAIVTGVLGSALTASVSAFYHPYLEGVSFPPWSYGALLGLGMGGAQSAALRPRLRLGGWWILITAGCAAVGLEVAVTIGKAAGPAGYGMVFGSFVGSGQWLVLRRQMERAGWWLVASALTLCASVISCGFVTSGAVRGMNALPNHLLALHAPGSGHGLNLLVRGLYGPMTWTELAVEFAVMATTGLVIGALTAKPLSSMLARAH